jgi:hypothetical protein
LRNPIIGVAGTAAVAAWVVVVAGAVVVGAAVVVAAAVVVVAGGLDVVVAEESSVVVDAVPPQPVARTATAAIVTNMRFTCPPTSGFRTQTSGFDAAVMRSGAVVAIFQSA